MVRATGMFKRQKALPHRFGCCCSCHGLPLGRSVITSASALPGFSAGDHVFSTRELNNFDFAVLCVPLLIEDLGTSYFHALLVACGRKMGVSSRRL